jgi:hypothetical protein
MEYEMSEGFRRFFLGASGKRHCIWLIACAVLLFCPGCLVSETELMVGPTDVPPALENSEIREISWSKELNEWSLSKTIKAIRAGDKYQITKLDSKDEQTTHIVKFRIWSNNLWLVQEELTGDSGKVSYRYGAIDVTRPDIYRDYWPSLDCTSSEGGRAMTKYGFGRSSDPEEKSCAAKSLETVARFYQDAIAGNPGGMESTYQIRSRP